MTFESDEGAQVKHIVGPSILHIFMAKPFIFGLMWERGRGVGTGLEIRGIMRHKIQQNFIISV
jgi:hypothetical protein